MGEAQQKQHERPKCESSKVTIPDAEQRGGMGKEERMTLLLEFMADHGLALPPSAIYRNLRFHQNVTFGPSSIGNYLDQFTEKGYVKRVNPEKLSDREVVEIPADSSKKAYYIITEKGRNELLSDD